MMMMMMMLGWAMGIMKGSVCFSVPGFLEGLEGRDAGQPAGKSGLEITSRDPRYVNVCTRRFEMFIENDALHRILETDRDWSEIPKKYYKYC